MSDPAPDITYRCVAGHEIAPADLDRRTDVRVLDGAAEIRLCREHGTPIVITKDGGGHAR